MSNQRGHHAFMVYEGASTFPDAHIAAVAAYLQSSWNVQIVVGYRPLHEWLPSKYNSVYKCTLTSQWPGELRRADGRQKHEEVLPFDIEDRGKFSDMFNNFATKYHKHPTEIVRDNYQRYFGSNNVVVMGRPRPPQTTTMAQGDPLLEHLFCSVIGNAPHICEAVIQGRMEFPSTAQNPSVSLNEDQLAVAAYRAGLLLPQANNNNNTATVVVHGNQWHAVRESIRKHLKKLQKDNGSYEFPLEWWSKDKLDRLEQLSLELERQLFAATWNSEQEQAHREGFAKAVANKKFCHMDTVATLQQPEWKSFFESSEAFR